MLFLALLISLFAHSTAKHYCAADKTPSESILKTAPLGQLPIPPSMLAVLAYYVADFDDFKRCIALIQEAYLVTKKIPAFKIDTTKDQLIILFEEAPTFLPDNEFLVSDEASAVLFLKKLREAIHKAFSKAWKSLLPIKDKVDKLSEKDQTSIANVITTQLPQIKKSHFFDTFRLGQNAYNKVCLRAKSSPEFLQSFVSIPPLERAQFLSKHLRNTPAATRDLLSSDHEVYALNHFIYVVSRHKFIRSLFTASSPQDLFKNLGPSDIKEYIEHIQPEKHIEAEARFFILMQAAISHMLKLKLITPEESEKCLSCLKNALILKNRIAKKTFYGTEFLRKALVFSQSQKRPAAYISTKTFNAAIINPNCLEIINWDIARWIERFFFPTIFTIYPGIRTHAFWCSDVWSSYIIDPLTNDLSFNGATLTGAAHHLAQVLKKQGLDISLKWRNPSKNTSSTSLHHLCVSIVNKARATPQLSPQLKSYADFLHSHIKNSSEGGFISPEDFWVHSQPIETLKELNQALFNTHPDIAHVCVQNGLLEKSLLPHKGRKIAKVLERVATENYESFWTYALFTVGRSLALPQPNFIDQMFTLCHPWDPQKLAQQTFSLLAFLTKFISKGLCTNITNAHDLATTLDKISQIKLILLFKKGKWPESFFSMARKLNALLSTFLAEHAFLTDPQSFFKLKPSLRQSTLDTFSQYTLAALRLFDKYVLASFLNEIAEDDDDEQTSN